MPVLSKNIPPSFDLFALPAVALEKVIRGMGVLEFIEFSLLSTKTFQLAKQIKYDAPVVNTYFREKSVTIQAGDSFIQVIRFDRIRGNRYNIEECTLGGYDCEKYWLDEKHMCTAWDHKESGVVFWMIHFRDIFTQFDPLLNFHLNTEEMDRDQAQMMSHLADRIYEYGWQNCTVHSYMDPLNDDDFLFLTNRIVPENSVSWMVKLPPGFMCRFFFRSKKVFFEHGHRVKLITIQLSFSTHITVNETKMTSKDLNTLIKSWYEGVKQYEFLRIEIPGIITEQIVADLPVEENKDGIEDDGHCVKFMLLREDGKRGLIYFDGNFVVLKVI